MKPYIKPLLILLPVIIAISYYLVSLSNRSEFSDQDAKVQSKPSAAELLTIEKITDWKGSSAEVSTASQPIVILHFWASWCAPCIHEFPDLINMVKAMNGKVKVIAFSEDNVSTEIAAFIKSFKEAETTENFHLVWDEKHKVMNDLEVTKLPESFIYGPDRKLAKHVGGVVSWTSQDTIEYLKTLLASESKPKE